MSPIPKAFLPTVYELAGFSRSKIRMNTMGATTVGPLDMSILEFPEGKISTHSLSLSGFVTTTSTAGTCTCPPVETLIDTMYIEIGGESIQPGMNLYGQIWQMFSDYQGTWNKLPIRQAINLQPASFSEVVAEGASTTAGGTPPTAANQTAVPFQLSNFLGFLNDIPILHTDKLPPVKIYIRWASNAVLAGAAAGTTGASYQISGLYAYVDQIIMPQTYNALLDQQLSKGPVSMPFTNFSVVPCPTTGLTQNSRWSSAADCVEAVHCTFLSPTYNAVNQTVDPVTYVSPYFTRGSPNLYKGLSSQLSVNGQLTPAFPQLAERGEVLQHTLQTFNEDHDLTTSPHPSMYSLQNINTKFFLHSFLFAYWDSDSLERKVGLSGRQNQLLGTWQTFSTQTDSVMPLIVLQHKSVLEIGGSGRAFRYIH